MSTKAPWISQLSLRNRNLSPLEENVLRMRLGWRAHALAPVNRGNEVYDRHVQEELGRLEARLRAQATVGNGRKQRPRFPKD